MAVRIRLSRGGSKKRPFYRIVAADQRAPRDGRFIEKIGTYNPLTDPAEINLKFDKAIEWLDKGAQPTDTVRSILSKKGVLLKRHLLGGIKKGALTPEQAEVKFQNWLKEKEAKNAKEIKDNAEKMREDRKARIEAECKVKEARAAEIAKKRAEIEAQKAAEAAAANAENAETSENVEVSENTEATEATAE